MSASVSFKDIQAMLDHCAKGYEWRLTTHSRRIKYNGRVYLSLPKFDTIELGHVRKMIRHLKIDHDCAKSMISIL